MIIVVKTFKPERNFRFFYVLIFLLLVFIPGDSQTQTLYSNSYEVQYQRSKRLFKWVNHKIYRIIFEESKRLPIKNPAHFVACLIDAESEGKATALGKPTRSGRARGLMQIMQFHVKRSDLNKLYNPQFNIRIGVKILRGFIIHRRGNLVKALKDYNSGPSSFYYNKSYIRKILRNYSR